LGWAVAFDNISDGIITEAARQSEQTLRLTIKIFNAFTIDLLCNIEKKLRRPPVPIGYYLAASSAVVNINRRD
jgi:hypothetical protein